jgi:hypothetical protein
LKSVGFFQSRFSCLSQLIFFHSLLFFLNNVSIKALPNDFSSTVLGSRKHIRGATATTMMTTTVVMMLLAAHWVGQAVGAGGQIPQGQQFSQDELMDFGDAIMGK